MSAPKLGQRWRMKLRWRIAHLLDRLPGQCWADLVGWVLRDRHDDPDWRSDIPWRPMGEMCRQDLARVGCCYCGKLRDQASTPNVTPPAVTPGEAGGTA